GNDVVERVQQERVSRVDEEECPGHRAQQQRQRPGDQPAEPRGEHDRHVEERVRMVVAELAVQRRAEQHHQRDAADGDTAIAQGGPPTTLSPHSRGPPCVPAYVPATCLPFSHYPEMRELCSSTTYSHRAPD